MTTGVTCLGAAWSLATWTRTKTQECTSARLSTCGVPSSAAEPACNLHVSDPTIANTLLARLRHRYDILASLCICCKSVWRVLFFFFLHLLFQFSFRLPVNRFSRGGNGNRMKCQMQQTQWVRQLLTASELHWFSLVVPTLTASMLGPNWLIFCQVIPRAPVICALKKTHTNNA